MSRANDKLACMTVVAVDVETANSARSSICSLAIASTGAPTRTWLLKPAPAHFDGVNMSIHGITPNAIAAAPFFADAWVEIGPELEGRTWIAHNASFDVAAILGACQLARVGPPSFDVVCTARLARALLPGRASYSLPFLCDELGIPLEHHDAASDARGSLAVLTHLLDRAQARDVDELLATLNQPAIRIRDGAHCYDFGQSGSASFGEDGVRGKRVAFTGALIAFVRDVATTIVERAGGIVTNGISKKLDYLVVGGAGGAGSKLEKARELVAAGEKIQIVTEAEFLRVLSSSPGSSGSMEPSAPSTRSPEAAAREGTDVSTTGRARGGLSFSFDFADIVSGSPELQAQIEQELARREANLASLPAEERAAVEAREAAREQAWAELGRAEERLHSELLGAAERETMLREERAAEERTAGRIGTQTEIGRPYGLSAIKVGRILDQHGLRELIEVTDDRYYAPETLALERYEREQDALRADLERRFPPQFPREPREQPWGRQPLRVMRGIIEGFATLEGFWIAEKVAPLIEAHGKRW